MSRPRKPFGPKQPGRLLATMVKVLAAESSDQGRLARGKRYWAEDAVVDIEIGPGVVTAEVQGSRPVAYVATLATLPGSGVPLRRELSIRCNCPDGAKSTTDACKHAVAAMFALSDEIAIDPALVERWRAGSRTADTDGDVVGDHEVGDDEAVTPIRPRSTTSDDPRADGSLAEVVELRPLVDAPDDLDGIGALLRAPAGASAPDLAEPTPIEHPPMRSSLLTEVLDDALDHLAIRWE